MVRQRELAVTYVPLGAIRPYDGNAKLHTDGQLAAVEASIREFGFANPVLLWHNDDGEPEIVAGHARCLAAQRLGMGEVPAVFLDDLTDAQRRALTLVDNQTTMMTGWDADQLAYELDTLSDDFDMGDMGFDVPTADEFGTAFSLPDRDAPDLSQATFTLAPEQLSEVMTVLRGVDVGDVETFGNENRNGNALYKVVSEWARRM